MLGYISSSFLPIFIFIIILIGYKKGIDIYNTFIEGAKNGLTTPLKIFPYFLAMVCSVYVFRASGLIDFIIFLLSPILNLFNVEGQLLPLVIFRTISGSGAVAVLCDIFKNFTPDSFIGLAASLLMGSTETTFYVLSVYLGSENIKNYRFAIKACILADICGFISAYILTILFFS